MKLKYFCIYLIFAISTLFAQTQIPNTYNNPIIPGFYPDPSICRVGDDYYLVNSSFEWFPGVPIFHSKDLVNWKQIGYVLDRPEQLKMEDGMPPSRGIWAPTIRYRDGLFYMITTAQNSGGNFYVTAKDPAGDWSNPIFLDAPGIDPEIFWDDDGSVWYVGAGNLNDKPQWESQNGCYIQKLDLKNGKVVGDKIQLTHGHASNARWTEGPHIFKIDGRYMLMVAEGGTGEHHAITVYESDNVTGPYTPSYINPVLTHRHLGKDYPITTTGHGDLVQTQNGDWWGVCLGVRPIEGNNMLGRETFLTPVVFENGWPVYNPGIGKVLEVDKRPDLPWTPTPLPEPVDEFNDAELAMQWNFLRTPFSKWYSLSEEKGKLSIELRPEKITDLVNPSFIARRIQHFEYTALTEMEFTSDKKNEEAGIVAIQNNKYHYRLVKNEDKIKLIKVENGKEIIVDEKAFNDNNILLGVKANKLELQFVYGINKDNLKNIGEIQDATILSTTKAGGFIGPYIGMYASSNGIESDSKVYFNWFEYSPVQ